MFVSQEERSRNKAGKIYNWLKKLFFKTMGFTKSQKYKIYE